MKKEPKKDKFYIINQPKHSILSIVILDNKAFQLSSQEHKNLEKLSKISDILFIFDEGTFKNTRFINEKKFATLYESSSWVSSEEGLLKTLINSFVYAKEIFKCHLSFNIINVTSLDGEPGSNLIDTDRIEKVNSSGTTYPILKIRRKNSLEFYDIYKACPEGILSKANKEDDTNKYSTHTSESNIIFSKLSTIANIINYCKTEEGKEYLSTFKTDDFRNFIASVIKHLGINYIDESIENVKV